MRRLLGIAVVTALVAKNSPAAAAGLTHLLKQEQTLWSTLSQLSGDLLRSQSSLVALEHEGHALDYAIRESKRRGDALQRRVLARRKRLRQRLLALYKLSRGGRARLVLEAKSWSEATHRAGMLRRIVTADLAELATFQKELAALTTARQQASRRYRNNRARHRALTQRLGRLQVRLKKQREATEDKTAQRRRTQRRLGHMTNKQRHLLRTIARLQRTIRQSANNWKEGLARPVSCAVAYRYGRATTGKTRLEISRPGWTYRCEHKRRVGASAAGTVRLAGPLSGYGNVVLLDHGGNRYSLYAYLDRVAVKKGQQVARKERLGLTGIDPLLRKNGLYFELRQGQTPLDPARLLR